MRTSVQRLSVPENKRLLVTSDIHGHKSLFLRLLEKANYAPTDDILILVGDLLEKGPDSLSTLRLIMRLCKEGAVYPLIGNVDDVRLSMLLSQERENQRAFVKYALEGRARRGSSLLYEMCQEVGVSLGETRATDKLFSLLRAHFAPEISFLQSLPTILETENLIFVHGGIPHERTNELEGMDRLPFLKWDHFLTDGLSFRKYVVVGHWPVALYSEHIPCYNPLVKQAQHIISIDGGCGVKSAGQLNLLILPGGDVRKLSFVSCDELPRITALEAQTGSAEAHLIKWGDNSVELLERGKEFSRILHHGQPMTVPTEYLYETENGLACGDVSDSVLSVRPGEQLGLITALSCGCYVKQNGIHGWYYGKYQKNQA